SSRPGQEVGTKVGTHRDHGRALDPPETAVVADELHPTSSSTLNGLPRSARSSKAAGPSASGTRVSHPSTSRAPPASASIARSKSASDHAYDPVIVASFPRTAKKSTVPRGAPRPISKIRPPGLIASIPTAHVASH